MLSLLNSVGRVLGVRVLRDHVSPLERVADTRRPARRVQRCSAAGQHCNLRTAHSVLLGLLRLQAGMPD